MRRERWVGPGVDKGAGQQAGAGVSLPRPMMPRGGSGSSMNLLPRSVAVYAPAAITPDSETPTQWSKFGTFTPHPFRGQGHDALNGAIMDVAQADTYNASPNPFPANPVWDVPGAQIAVLLPMRKEPSTSAHPGRTMASGPGPSMYFQAPPVFGQQTIPIMAVGV